MLHIQNLKRWYHPTVKLHTAFCMTLFCHARNMSDRYSIFLTHVNRAVVRSMKHTASERFRLNLDRTGSDRIGPDQGSDHGLGHGSNHVI